MCSAVFPTAVHFRDPFGLPIGAPQVNRAGHSARTPVCFETNEEPYPAILHADREVIRSPSGVTGQMAKRMGISQAAYSQMERAGSRLRKATREKIAEAVGIACQKLEA